MIKLTGIPGSMRRPVSRRLQVRRSTALMVVLFIGLGVVWLQVRTPSTSTNTGSRALDQAINSGLKPGESFTITRAGTTTTTVAPNTATTKPETSTTTRSPSTTVTLPTSHSTTTVPQLGQEPTTTSGGPGVSATTKPSTDIPSTTTSAPKSPTSTP